MIDKKNMFSFILFIVGTNFFHNAVEDCPVLDKIGKTATKFV